MYELSGHEKRFPSPLNQFNLKLRFITLVKITLFAVLSAGCIATAVHVTGFHPLRLYVVFLMTTQQWWILTTAVGVSEQCFNVCQAAVVVKLNGVSGMRCAGHLPEFVHINSTSNTKCNNLRPSVF